MEQAALRLAQDNLKSAWLPFQKAKWSNEIQVRQQLAVALEPYVPLTQEEQELQDQGKLEVAVIREHLPRLSNDRLMKGICGSGLLSEVITFFVVLLPAHGVETWEAALQLDAASTCFKGVPAGLVAQLLSVIEQLRRSEAQALARAELLRRLYGTGQWALSYPGAVAGLLYSTDAPVDNLKTD